MSVSTWRGVVNGILYTVQFQQELDDAQVERTARAMIAEPLYDLPTVEIRDAVSAALDSDEQLTQLIPEAHGEAEFRAFLRRVVERLDALRPWPEPAYRRLPAETWRELAGAPVVAHVPLSHVKLQERLRKLFQPVADGAVRRPVLVLRLAAGDVVAFAGSTQPAGTGVDVHYAGPRPAAEVLRDLQAAAGLSPAELVPASRP